MKEELEKIGIQLQEWCNKYNKNYVTMFVLEGSVIANVSPEDKDHKELNVFIQKK